MDTFKQLTYAREGKERDRWDRVEGRKEPFAAAFLQTGKAGESKYCLDSTASRDSLIYLVH